MACLFCPSFGVASPHCLLGLSHQRCRRLAEARVNLCLTEEAWSQAFLSDTQTLRHGSPLSLPCCVFIHCFFSQIWPKGLHHLNISWARQAACCLTSPRRSQMLTQSRWEDVCRVLPNGVRLSPRAMSPQRNTAGEEGVWDKTIFLFLVLARTLWAHGSACSDWIRVEYYKCGSCRADLVERSGACLEAFQHYCLLRPSKPSHQREKNECCALSLCFSFSVTSRKSGSTGLQRLSPDQAVI